jgi:hypothetical protein
VKGRGGAGYGRRREHGREVRVDRGCKDRREDNRKGEKGEERKTYRTYILYRVRTIN